MAKEVIIAGIGMGRAELMTCQVMEDIKSAQVLIGAERMLQAVQDLGNCDQKVMIQGYHPEEIVKAICEQSAQKYCVLMSGDTGFYSGTKRLSLCLKEASDEIEVFIHPGISSLSYLCAVFKKDYNEVSLASLHGRNENIAYKVHTHKLTFLLTNGNGAEIAQHLCEYGLAEVMMYVGCQLSYEDEKIFACKAKDYDRCSRKNELAKANKKCLISILIENPCAISRMTALTEQDFIRGKVPMTKDAIRYQISAMLDVKQDGIIYDIGAGTGGVTMELARKIPDGTIYAIECNPEGIELINANKKRCSMDQVTTIEGMAPEALGELPDANAVFIGGSKGRLLDILKQLQNKKAQQRVPVVISAITLETFHELLSLTQKDSELLSEPQLMQMQVSDMVTFGKYHRLEPMNPIWLMKGYL